MLAFNAKVCKGAQYSDGVGRYFFFTYYGFITEHFGLRKIALHKYQLPFPFVSLHLSFFLSLAMIMNSLSYFFFKGVGGKQFLRNIF